LTSCGDGDGEKDCWKVVNKRGKDRESGGRKEGRKINTHAIESVIDHLLTSFVSKWVVVVMKILKFYCPECLRCLSRGFVLPQATV